MSNIQKYIRKKYELGGITLDPVQFQGFDLPQSTELPPMSPSVQQMMQPQQRTGAGQFLQNIGSKFGGELARGGFQELTGGQNIGELFSGMTKGEGPGADLLSTVMQGTTQGGGLDVGSLMGKVSDGGGIGNPLDLVGSGLDSLADDNDATTYSVGEIGADVAGVGMGVGRIMSGDVVGGVKKTVGELVDIGKSVFGRKKARKEQTAAEKQAKEDYFAREGAAAQKRVAAGMQAEQQSKSSEAQAGMQSMLEKYKIAKHGARLNYEEGGVNEGTRPLDLRTMKYYKGGILENLRFKEGGMTKGEKARLALDAAGMVNPLAGFAAGALDAKDAIKYAKEGNYWDAAKAGGMAALGFIPFGGSVIKTGLKGGKQVANLVKNAKKLKKVNEGVVKNVLKATKATGKGDKYDVQDKVQELVQENKGKQIDSPLPAGDTPFPFMFGKAEKGARLSFDPMDYYTGGYLKYVKGGMTPGKFSHKTNPLTVVDKKGNDTGMELTGGEGVFDKGAMTKLDKYKATKNYEKAGKLVFSEMDSWKDAGTAKYGTRIKYK